MIMLAQAVTPPAPDVASVLQSFLPAKYVGPAVAIFVALTTIGRAITALRNDPGVVSMFKSVFMGSSTTTQAVPNKGVAAVPATPASPAVAAVPPATKV